MPHQLHQYKVKQLAAVAGEVDIIKSIQLLPGVTSVSEGANGFNVRGGAVDQNLVLLDEMTLYNASHLFGFFSVFNADAIKDMKLYKGGIPAEYGSRVSSVLDVRQKEGNSNFMETSGGIGLISSRLMLEGPLWDKSSFMVAGRRSYGDLFLALSNDTTINDNKLYFYDLNQFQRVPGNGTVFADVDDMLEEKLQVFESIIKSKSICKNIYSKVNLRIINRYFNS